MAWWPADKWTMMVRGDDCTMCADAHLPRNDFGDLIAERQFSYVRLNRNQTHAGYATVIAKRHVPELHDLTREEIGGFYGDVAAIGQVIVDLFNPVKLANLSMGFRMPHYHCHVYPEYQHDDPFRPIDITDGHTRLSPSAWDQRIALMRDRLTD